MFLIILLKFAFRVPACELSSNVYANAQPSASMNMFDMT